MCALLLERYNNGKLPIAMVSMDNCSHNGEKLKNAIMAYVKAWNENGFVSDEFVQYVDDENQVSFPWSMIDKITPRPDDKVSEIFKKDGVEDMDPVKTSRGSFVAPFVNAEETEYLVIEDQFPNGRPALEKGGLIFTDRETVNKVETMKVTTCLNPLHTALAVFGCLLDYTLISAEMQDADLVGLIKAIGYKEGLPVVINGFMGGGWTAALMQIIDIAVGCLIWFPFFKISDAQMYKEEMGESMEEIAEEYEEKAQKVQEA